MSRLAHLNILQSCRRLLVAFSGGLDSTVLLHQLAGWRQQNDVELRAIHIHHGLSPHADEWVMHCQQQCAQWQIPLIVERVAVDGREAGIEGAARAARYAAFRQALLPDEVLVTAQHLDDQAETLLLALKRGSGPAGLAAMPATLSLGEHQLVRPLLTQSRAQLVEWAQAHQLSWIEDESNLDTRFDRNFLRQQVLPILSVRWPHFSQAAARSAALCGEQEQLLDELLAASLSQQIQGNGSLLIPPLLNLSEAHRNALLRRWIALQGGKMPSRDALARIWHEVILSRPDAVPCLQLGLHQLRRYRDALYWLPPFADISQQVLPWQAPWAALQLPDNLGIVHRADVGQQVRAPREDEGVSIRFQAHGHVHILGRNGGRSMKKIWQELGIPPWQRERTPLIYYNEQLIAAPGLFTTVQGRDDTDSGWHICWQHHE
ncbi:tRNA lysidine(34) synthetase TilS [Duffyella gerundensis]|jgi:tRNA(Ile)-lysidine synthase|uniref:tRNA lysidine(34) synthetase TilS n=1 Tax=Duffyella gerundensis TaxID=1619313 RepID=UPI0016543805|nr:tRNA lysidine(34) synthetase TilS [Duffyella gerundensis]